MRVLYSMYAACDETWDFSFGSNLQSRHLLSFSTLVVFLFISYGLSEDIDVVVFCAHRVLVGCCGWFWSASVALDFNLLKSILEYPVFSLLVVLFVCSSENFVGNRDFGIFT